MQKNLKANDTVVVIAGENKGTKAKIVKMDRKAGKACLEGIGIIERHLKKSYANPKGGKKTVHVGIDLSNLKLVEAAKVEKKAKAADKKADSKNSRSEAKADKKEAKAKKGAK